MMKSLVRRYLFYYPWVRHCSQTVYQAMFGCTKMLAATGEQVWYDRACGLQELLRGIQCSDGGFDIGYEFNFGHLHKVGESTAPEMFGLLALAVFERFTDNGNSADCLEQGIRWIEQNAIEQEGRCYIPYGPSSTKELMVYNGTSFAATALGAALGVTGKHRLEARQELYEKLVTFLFDSLVPGDGGSFWYYNDQQRVGLDPKQRGKIDYYHQMQQVEVHSIAQQFSPLPVQMELIRNASDYICSQFSNATVVPYTNLSNDIPVWGLGSVVSGLLEASLLLPERQASYRQLAGRMISWLVDKSWTGEFFAPLLDPSGKVKINQYMVRSDAWVFSSLSTAFREGAFSDEGLIEKCYRRMMRCNFSGREYHASTPYSRSRNAIVGHLVRGIQRMVLTRV